MFFDWNSCRSFWFAASAIAFLCGPLRLAAEAPQESLGCYFSTGDNDWLWDSPPVQSAADIEAVFDSLQQVFGVSRVYWRGAQSALIGDHYLVRPENFQLYDFWQWEGYLTREVGTSRLAVEAAHRRGMDIWGMTALFDHGAQAEVDSANGCGPSPIEDRLRIDHPEWVPIDRYDIRRQAGPLEFAYPEVRRALVDRYANRLAESGYDGLMYYTYVEHFAMRFENEYGYNDLIAEEFQRRYGQDPRTESFDKHAWYRLRGEYVTQFLRELKARFVPSGKKLGVAIDPQNSHFPAPWLCVRDVINTGRIYLDWERWVREGIVDEIMVYCNGSLEASLNAVFSVTRGTDCQVSAIYGTVPFPPHHQHFTRAGLRRVIVGSNHDIEAGYSEEQPLAALKGDDPLARMRVLQQIVDGKLEAELEQIIEATNDPHVLVRRQAAQALAATGKPEVVPALEAALDDSEHSVRCAAAAALGQVKGPNSVARLLEAVGRYDSFQLNETIASTLANLDEDRTEDLLEGASSPRPQVRRVAVYALGRGHLRPEARPVLLGALADKDDYVRYLAAYGLARFASDPKVMDGLLAALRDPHPTVRARAALSLRSGVRSHSRWLSARQFEVLQTLRDLFRQFGEGDEVADADWGYRCIGETLAAMGPRGREVLEEHLRQREHLRLADFAWRILYAPQSGHNYLRVAEEEAERTYRLHPRLTPDPAPPQPRPVEPEFMPYLDQHFDDFPLFVRDNVGDYLSEAGEWRGFSDLPPAPVVQNRMKHGKEGHAVRLTRGPAGTTHNLAGLRVDYRLSTERTFVEFWCYLAGTNASLAVHWKDSGTGVYPVGLYIAPGGDISLGTFDGKWVPVEVQLPLDSWQRIRFDIDPANQCYTVHIGKNLETVLGKPVSLPAEPSYNVLTFSPQAPEGGVTYLDDVSVRVPNPAP